MTEEKTYAVCFVCKKIFAGEDINKHTRPMVINNATETDICDACYGALTTHNRYAGRIYKGTPVVQDNVFVGHNVTFINDLYPRATTESGPQTRQHLGTIATKD